MERKDAYLLLWCTSGIGYKTIQSIEAYLGDIGRIWDVDDAYIDSMEFASAKARRALVEGIKSNALHRIKENLLREHIAYMTIECEGYPSKLKQIHDPPYVLFYRGDSSLLENFSIAMVGSRKPSAYGELCSKKFSRELSSLGITIVSGLAIGIDSCSHYGAYNQRGRTVAVLGSSIDNPYPVRNIGLMNKIVQSGGVVVSEYPPGTKTLPGFFPMRNRIISGLSDGVLIVEAAKKSGSLITMDYALDQGRNVYSVPGNINSAMSEGTNRIIKTGAKLVTCVEDILEDYRLELKKPDCEMAEASAAIYSESEAAIVNALRQSGIMHIDSICDVTAIPPSEIIGVLNILQIKGIVLELGANTYAIA